MAKQKFSSSNNDITAGLVILIVGVILLLKAVGFWFPVWFISWPMILIAIGLIILARHNFQNGFGFFMLLLGSFFLVRNYFGFPFELRPYLVPTGLIIFGLYLILKRSKDNKRFNEEFFKSYKKYENPSQQPFTSSADTVLSSYQVGGDKSEVISAQALFTGIQRRIFSKSFKGGKTSAIFGGIELDLSQADIDGQAVLQVEIAFGGVKLVVPPHWDVQVNMGTVFAAGVEDKRIFNPSATDSNKVLKIHGSMVFGGLEIKSF
ncbi:LiaF transmembrane domain-containing protein [Cecembia rubra]|uniref:Cell wall-active antibiotic response 4TMS protein YvqF n=1 Tax=Cecembia rubra TaxID=1485585 RepID=A0A2P8E649_9BACT|nr:LiaF domain-containing protein [Cecembia rubra]PSL04897.1 cell wall-active antibiotic response 4TMS protein YvqF [Cecembia rubra]